MILNSVLSSQHVQHKAVMERIHGRRPLPVVQPLRLLPPPPAEPPVQCDAHLIEFLRVEGIAHFHKGAAIPLLTIVATVARHYGVSKAKIMKGGGRLSSSVEPRRVAIYLIRTMKQCSFPDIGRRLGGFDHTTILHHFKIVRDRLASGALPAAEMELIISNVFIAAESRRRASLVRG